MNIIFVFYQNIYTVIPKYLQEFEIYPKYDFTPSFINVVNENISMGGNGKTNHRIFYYWFVLSLIIQFQNSINFFGPFEENLT